MLRARSLAPIAALILLAGLMIVTGCDVRVLYGPPFGSDKDDSPSEPIEDSTLLTVVEPNGSETFYPNDIVSIQWSGSIAAPTVAIEVYRYGQPLMSIDPAAPNTGTYEWIIPPDFDTVSEAPDDYQISLRAEDPDHAPGMLLVQALSERFTIAAAESDTDGLTDVVVSQSTITVTVTDNGQQIDGDTVDIILNGTTILSGHVLAEPPGTDIELVLEPGANVLEILAINEGSVSPNTAELAISNVAEGEPVQQWRLLAGERGSLTITAP